MLLEFEQPIVELEGKLAEMKQLAESSRVDVTEDVKSLEKKIQKLKEETYKNLTRWQRVQLSRHPERPYTLDYIYNITDDFVEIHGDRTVKDDKAMVGGFGTINGQTVMLVGQQKGRNTKQRQMRNFGMANPEGYRKALRLFKMAEKFNKPIVTLIDTPGAYPGFEAEERGQGEAIARNIKEMFMLKVPVICIIIGEGASGGAIGIAIGDKVLMLENSWYSVISPESCSSILWRSWDYKEQAAEALKLTATDMQGFGLIDGIIEEPLGGAHRDSDWMFNTVKDRILKEIASLQKLSTEELINQRIDKFSNMGEVVE
ncbi:MULTISPECIES: acetyl-CoA carboxylase carboxyltransferase subunit alpha [Roseivirga]|jgi:acetyl-CoA carboxylase carboxyl transferase subunit alpha|uniref:Acetyl-coenzyme A carboxylase carboxyl transferase subunit alpha n=1 Tax=Roseivirga spongicola TaxID=333140 RepID=A0A150X4S1_9BACT|nr:MULTISPECIES: acetyl-CoA carboxylase carboxyltransferase subunit alpha [Roseivirga]PWL31838.1 MAG: acetyl-CoA carboxylase carboxyltransferase subunit alpha [Roseivirga sp. XM-24bin3]KYG73698.1 acetyl-CoA carboxyl transferase [Roseivirga spongicola]MBO6496792.1 acetyl-CoA carboxylase carboxyltransferase subunit alpha [Roseivirga sp.]MBO6659970.1 acetyl-CoA carboxylase carboxyltransferase subunit alpha [Roseivirga sp.]MBO6761646.1 acetyl-CoA carboxylase carboxyltransferase subunit alpha [Rose